MSTMTRTWLAAACAASIAGCGEDSPMEPVDVPSVSIDMAVTGGLLGVDYSFSVRGDEGEVRGLTCLTGCGFEADELLAVVSDDLIADLAARLDDTGILQVGEQDFGDGCCDFLHIELTYRRNEDTATVRGSQDTFPTELNEVVALLHSLEAGVVPMLVAPNSREVDWPRDAYTLGDVTVEGPTLSAELSYSGGCASHRMDLVAWGGWLEAFPVEVNALVTHDDADDMCDSIVDETRQFDLRPLRWAYEEAYGPIGEERPTVILRLWDPLGEQPLGRLVEVPL